MPRVDLTPFQAHRNRWKDGCGSEHCAGATVCLVRGSVPCDVLFVGEAPGESENAIGHPFVRGAPSGRLMQRIIDEAFEGYVQPVRYALTNLVGCIPRDEDGGKLKAPEYLQVKKCKPRLEEFVRLCSPRLVVCVGKETRDWVMGGLMDGIKLPPGVKAIHIVHPAWILRSEMPVVRRGFEVQKCVVTIRAALDNLDSLPDQHDPEDIPF